MQMSADNGNSVLVARARPSVYPASGTPILAGVFSAVFAIATASAFMLLASVSFSNAAFAQTRGEMQFSRPMSNARDSTYVVKGWEDALRGVEKLVAAGKARKAYSRATRLLQQAGAVAISGDQVERVLGRALVLKSIAAYDLHRLDEAVWLWHSALMVSPGAGDLALSAYGDAGVFLEEHPPRELSSPPYSSARVEPPIKRVWPLPDFPAAQVHRNKGVVVVETVIDKNGELREPLLVSNSGPVTFLSATLDRLTEWRFSPAYQNGVPVAVKYQLKVNFTW